LNGVEILSLQNLEGHLNTGSNVLELKTKAKSQSTYQNTATLTINYATTDLSQFRIRVYRDEKVKLYKNHQTIGDVDEGEKILSIDETIKLELLQRNEQEGWRVVNQPVWEIRDNKYNESIFELQLKELMSQVTVIKSNLMGEELRINLDIERQEEEIKLPDNNFANINVSALISLSNSKRNKRKQKYAKALETIKIESANLYNRFSNSIPSLQVYIVPS